MDNIIRTKILFLLISIFSSLSFAEVKETRELPEDRQLSAQLQDILRSYDPWAIVLVKSEKNIISQKIRPPAVPFVLEEVVATSGQSLNGTNGNDSFIQDRRYSKLKVTVFSTSGSLPQTVVDVMTRVAKNYSNKVQFLFEKLPKDLTKSLDEEQPSNEKTWEPILSETLTKFQMALDDARSVYNVISAQGAMIKTAFYGLLALFGILLLAVSVAFLLMQRRLQSLLSAGLQGVATALDRTGQYSSENSSTLISPALAAPRSVSTEFGFRELNALSDDGLLALVSDCYWSKQDDYGAFLWRHIHPDKKLMMIDRMPEIENYARYLLNQPEVNLNLDQDPAYLRPLKLWHLDMQDLTKFVRLYPNTLRRLSPLRLAALHLSPKERISLYATVERHGSEMALNIPVAASPLRALEQTMAIRIRSEKDEIEVLEMKNLSLAVISDVPSLGWLLRLPTERSRELLKTISARELAAAWTGPQNVLDKIENQLGEKKKEMLKSLLERVYPSRDSIEFLNIHRSIVTELQRFESTLKQESEEENPKASEREFLNAG